MTTKQKKERVRMYTVVLLQPDGTTAHKGETFTIQVHGTEAGAVMKAREAMADEFPATVGSRPIVVGLFPGEHLNGAAEYMDREDAQLLNTTK